MATNKELEGRVERLEAALRLADPVAAAALIDAEAEPAGDDTEEDKA